MPAKSQSQQHLMGMAQAVREGKKPLRSLPRGAQEKVKAVNKSMGAKALKHFASTPSKHLPERVGKVKAT